MLLATRGRCRACRRTHIDGVRAVVQSRILSIWLLLPLIGVVGRHSLAIALVGGDQLFMLVISILTLVIGFAAWFANLPDGHACDNHLV